MTSITKTKVRFKRGKDKEVSFNVYFDKAYYPDEHFIGSSYHIADEETFNKYIEKYAK